MAKRRSSRSKSRRKLQVGDRVSFRFGDRRVIGTVIEDRGAIGAHGVQLLAVQAPLYGSEPSIIELPVDELRAA
jgi:hypothetical protein